MRDDREDAGTTDFAGCTATGPLEGGAAGRLPATIGRYRIHGLLGQGGMGVVYEAEQESPRRRVALKVIRGGQFVDDSRARMFRREAETLARLEHPSIGGIYESGRTEDGQHFFAMELVRGETLDAYVKRRGPIDPGSGAGRPRDEARFRVALLRKIAEAVHYAHQRGVIHRDLKPSNIVVTGEPGGEESTVSESGPAIPRLPQVKILDFGLARITEGDIAAATIATEVGAIKGTLAYMAPEQARGNPDEIDARSDVYSLGMILYEMLAGRRPYDVARRSLVEAVRAICEEPAPALRSTAGAAARIDADIETIVAKALEKERGRRYASAGALAQDIERYLLSQPILARPPSTVYQLRKFAARNRVLVGGVVATMLALAVGVVVSTTLGLREARERRAADAARSSAERAGYVANLVAAEAGLRLYEVAEVKRRLAACPPALRGWEWRHLTFRSEMSERVLMGHSSRVYPVTVSPDGTLYASGSADPENEIRLWDAATGRAVRVITNGLTPPSGSAGVRSLAFSPDGARLAAAADDRSVRIWEVATGRKLLELTGHEARVNAVAFTPDGSEIVSASWDKTVRRWDAGSGASLGVLTGHEGAVWGLAVCGDGTRIVSGSADGAVRVWERTGRPIFDLRAPAGVLGVACSPAGDRAAAAMLDGTIRMWDTRSGAPLELNMRHDDYLVGLAFSPDGRMLASASKDRTVRLWDARTGSAIATLVGHVNAVTSVAFDPAGAKLISGSWDRTLREWSLEPARLSPVLASEPGTIVGLDLTPDGSRIVSASREAGVRIRDSRSGLELAAIPNPGAPLVASELSRDGTLLATYDAAQTMRIFRLDPDGRPQLVREQVIEDLGAADFVPGAAEMLVGSSQDGTLRRFSFETGEFHGEIATSLTKVSSVEPTADGARAVVAGRLELNLGGLQLVDLASGQRLALQAAPHIDPNAKIGNPVTALEFSPDGTRLVSTHGQDFTVRLWDARTLEPLATMPGHTEIVRAAAFSPDGSRIATGADDYTVRLWDSATGEPLLALRTERLARVGFVAFTPDGETIVSAESAGSGSVESAIRLWRTR